MRGVGGDGTPGRCHGRTESAFPSALGAVPPARPHRRPTPRCRQHRREVRASSRSCRRRDLRKPTGRLVEARASFPRRPDVPMLARELHQKRRVEFARPAPGPGPRRKPLANDLLVRATGQFHDRLLGVRETLRVRRQNVDTNSEESSESASVCQEPSFDRPNRDSESHQGGRFRQMLGHVRRSARRVSIQIDQNEPWPGSCRSVESRKSLQQVRLPVPNEHLVNPDPQLFGERSNDGVVDIPFDRERHGDVRGSSFRHVTPRRRG